MSSPKWRPTRASKTSGVQKFLDSFSERKSDLPRSRLEDLVGEAAQNALDARLGDAGPVDIEFEVMSVDPKNPEWKSLIGKQAVSEGNFKVLRVSNRHAKGLGGAHGNRPPDGDYQKFMGFDSDSSKSTGGGSYGYGRSTYFTASRSHRLLVDSVYKDGKGSLMRRLVGVRFMTKDEIEISNDSDNEAHSAGIEIEHDYCDGIEVWGTDEPNSVVSPIEEPATSKTGDIANLAKSMNLHRGTGEIVEGTDFYVLDLECGETLCKPHTPESLEEHLMGALLWRLWPALQDGIATAGVTQGGSRTDLRLDPPQSDLWPIFAFARLRDLARDIKVVDALAIGGSRLAVYRSSTEKMPKVYAASYTLPGPRRGVAPYLKSAYPGTKFWDPARTTGIVSVVRFRENKLVVNYEDHVHCAHKPVTSLAAPTNKHIWTLGVLEVTDPDLSEDIRLGRKTPGKRGRKIEDVSHTDWSWSKNPAMKGFEAVSEACEYLAANIGIVAAVPVTLMDQSGAAVWSRGLGELFPVRRGAPSNTKVPKPGKDGSGAGGDKRSKKTLLPQQPQIVANDRCYVFGTKDLEVGSTYVLEVEVQSVSTGESDYLPKPTGYILDGTKVTSLNFGSFTPAAGQQIAVKIPEPPVAVMVTAKLQTSSTPMVYS